MGLSSIWSQAETAGSTIRRYGEEAKELVVFVGDYRDKEGAPA